MIGTFLETPAWMLSTVMEEPSTSLVPSTTLKLNEIGLGIESPGAGVNSSRKGNPTMSTSPPRAFPDGTMTTFTGGLSKAGTADCASSQA
jgi:hypothetical protein